MEIPENIEDIINKLYSNKLLGLDELHKIELWIHQIQTNREAESALKMNWGNANNVETELSFDELRRRIKQSSEKLKRMKWQYWGHHFQRAAAILLLPVLILTSWLVLHDLRTSPQWLTLTTHRGERTHVILPDGSEVWLNVDTKLEYPTSYNQNNRLLKLQGEAFFKVAKGKKYPFVVNARNFKVMAVGTEFNISAYPDDPEASTFLKKGIVKFTYAPEGQKTQVFEMKPGQETVINIPKNTLKLDTNASDYTGNWRDGELYFDNDSMDRVFRKIERWYGVTIHFQPKQFTGETLVLRLKNGEPVSRVLEIINDAMGIEYKNKGKVYWIVRKN